MGAYRAISRCRICGNARLVSILDLGRQALTGVFPKKRSQKITAGPLELVRCAGGCGLVQLRHSYDKKEMYGRDYGYHSGLNRSMVEHLRDLVREVSRVARPRRGDLVVDIGSNDGTLLGGYAGKGLDLVGVDPTGARFKRSYPKGSRLIVDFFSAKALRARVGAKKAKIVTSIAMFYDLDAPLDFMREIASILEDDGVWMLEQSYLPAMLESTAYDTVCHEHLEYYSLGQIEWMAERAGLRIIDVEVNDVNGGSFCIMLAKRGSSRKPNAARINALSRSEAALSRSSTYKAFKRAVFEHRAQLIRFLKKAKAEGKVVLGYGASTKGNVILQFCGLTPRDIPCIGEVNRDKFGCFTPGTLIPIVPEAEARARRPDYLMVLPWHFKKFIVAKEAAYRKSGGKLFFPLPKLEIE
jgi:NDP-4-keto-2,6-dideoxyhexose 3-C-methyltransferase